MKEGGFQAPLNGDGLVTQIFFKGNAVTNNRRALGIMAGIT